MALETLFFFLDYEIGPKQQPQTEYLARLLLRLTGKMHLTIRLYYGQ